MTCPGCQQENPAQARFCMKCGTALTLACAKCNTELPAGAAFCFACGQPVTAAPSRQRFTAPDAYTPRHLAEKILTSKAALEGERKQVTVLFADLKGSMELLADRDPEEARKLLDPVLERMMEAVHHYEGTVNQVMGDGIMALFGAPLAHEDHAVRACYAALRMQRRVNLHADDVQRAGGTPVQIRVGLNSGEVVVRAIGNDLHMDYTAVGQTTHLAARMEQMAKPGSALVTGDTLRLAEGYVEVEPLGAVPVKGLQTPTPVYELTGIVPTRSRFQASTARGLTRFVGRDRELQQLVQALERAAAGHGQALAVVGEAGLGKSRLVWEFARSHHTHGWLVLESGSVSYGKATPYLPVIELLKAYCRIQERDDQRAIRERVAGKLLMLDRSLESLLTPLLALLDVPIDDKDWETLDPPQRRRQTLEAVKRLLLRESQVQPLLLIVEDLHWIDSETQALLDGLMESLPTARILFLANYRPEYQHSWGSKTYYLQLRIDPLPPESAEGLLTALLGEDPSLESLKRTLIARTEGNPFFLEESVRTLVETQMLVGERGAYRMTRAPEAWQMPPTAQAILAARIDRLPPEDKRLLQAASVIGKDVPFALLHAIADTPEDDLRLGLTHLQAAEFLYETSLFPDLEYTFKHALTHEVAYGTLLHDRRRALHAGIVTAIEQLYGDRLGEQMEILAHHAVRGEAWDKAVVYLREAGTKAFRRSANSDAVSYFTRGLEIVETLPDGAERDRHQLAQLLGLGPAIQALKGLGAPEAERVFSRARELSERVGDTGAAFQALWGQWMFSAGQGRIVPARRIGGELLTLAERTNDRVLLLEAHHAMWATSFWLGELSAADQHIGRGISLYDREEHRSLAFLYGGHDPGACCRYFSTWTHWLFGRPLQAMAASDASIAFGEQLAHPPTIAIGLTWACALQYFERNIREAGHLARYLINLATERDLPPWRVAGTIFEGWTRAEAAEGAAGIAQIREGLRAAKTTGTLMPLEPLYLLVLADACWKVAQVEEGLRVIDETLTMMAAMGERIWLSELHRLKGELLHMRVPTDHAAAEGSFREALTLARQQGAQAWELRAATSLGRLLGQRGRRDEARHTLGDVYDRFTEGLDTPNLTEARALLAELS